MNRRSHGQAPLGLFDGETGVGDRVCGVDEAGRGALAGPVIAAAVILDSVQPIEGLRDSKKMSPRQRERVASLIRERALAWAVGAADVAEIDTINILQATLRAMERAVSALQPAPVLALVDGNQLPRLSMPARCIVGGDDSEPAISAASILAKTHRDALMRSLDISHPGYGFAQHAGYGTAAHLRQLRLLGACTQHRRSYAPVLAVIGAQDGT
jgi:ribonuclease HII